MVTSQRRDRKNRNDNDEPRVRCQSRRLTFAFASPDAEQTRGIEFQRTGERKTKENGLVDRNSCAAFSAEKHAVQPNK